jgi:DNA-binding transcriptional LysR family regulator
MKLNHLELFVMIAEEGQIGRAAAKAGITQPALTKNLVSLERAVGSRLFDRGRAGAQLTQAGKLLLTRAKEIIRGTVDARRELAELAAGTAGHLRIGAGPTLAAFLLTPVVNELLSRGTGIELRVTSATNDLLFESLREGALDVVLSGIPETPPDDFEQELLLHDEAVVVAGSRHFLARKKRVALRELVGRRWALPPPRVLARQWLNDQFEKRRLPLPRTAIEADSAAAMISIAAATDLITFQPRSNLSAFNMHGAVSEIRCPDLRWQRPIGISRRRGAYLPLIGHQLIASLHAMAARLASSSSRHEVRDRKRIKPSGAFTQPAS